MPYPKLSPAMVRGLIPWKGLSMQRPHQGFTLVELLVVVAIIVVLLALLLPGMDKAITAAERAKCLVNQRTIVVACQGYAAESRGYFPVYTMPGIGRCSGWDLRTSFDDGSVRKPMGIGLTVVQGQLPATQLGKVVHCPTMDTTAIPNGTPGHCMDRDFGYGAGGSWWTDAARAASLRIIPGFNYRAASFFQKGLKTPTGRVGGGHLRTGKMGQDFVISVDTLDWRVGIRYVHLDGYNRVFADGHGSYYSDPGREIEALGAGQNIDGTSRPEYDELLYDELAREPF